MTLRIQKAEVPAELREALIEQVGSMPEPIEVAYNNPKAAITCQEFTAKLLSTYDSRGGGRNEMRACQTRGSAESVMPQALSAIAVQRSAATLEVSR
jgi:hypothetical protein